MAASTVCEICGVPTNVSFKFAGRLHYFCPAHEDELFEQVTGRAPKQTPKPPEQTPEA
jgi:hypothetical protein